MSAVHGIVGACLLCAAVAVTAGERLRICEEVSEWAPFSFVESASPGTDATAPLAGFSLDVLRAMQLPYEDIEVQALPWLRCLAEVEQGIEARQQSAAQPCKPGSTDGTSRPVSDLSPARPKSHLAP